jgi:hypothetical protein
MPRLVERVTEFGSDEDAKLYANECGWFGIADVMCEMRGCSFKPRERGPWCTTTDK